MSGRATRLLRVWVLCVGLALSWPAVAQGGLEVVRDTGYEPNLFNPGDSGLVQRVRLRDNDTDHHPVVLTKVQVENLGTAGDGEVEWVQVVLNVGGRRALLAESTGFPVMAHLAGPTTERVIPDDGLGFLEVSVGTTAGVVDGHTVHSRVSFWYTEGDYGGSKTVTAGHAAVFTTRGFDAELLPESTVGAVNPGDVFVALRFEVADDLDNNLHSIYLTEFTVDGPGMPEVAKWQLVIGPDSVTAPSVDIPLPGAAELPPEGMLTALAGSSGVVELRGVVGPEPTDGVAVQPTVSLSLKEGPNTRTFTFTAPSAITIRDAGFEVLENLMLVRPGQILDRRFQELEHSTVHAQDEDANRTPVSVSAVNVTNRGTADRISYIEVWDERNRLLGVGESWGDIGLAQPDGRALRVPDDGDMSLRFVLGVGEDLPLGASLLLCKELAVEEIHPSLITPTRFSGLQGVCDNEAVFFGRPTVWLSGTPPQDSPRQLVQATVGTDGETVNRVEGVLRFDRALCVEIVDLSVRSPYRLADSEVRVYEETGQGELHFSLELTGGSARPGELVAVTFAYALPDGTLDRACAEELLFPTEQELEAAGDEPVPPLLAVDLQLQALKLVDTANIELPFTLQERQLTLKLPAPLPPEVEEEGPEEMPEEDVPEEDTPDEG